MKKKVKVTETIAKILTDLKEENYADYTIGVYRQCYNGLQKYMQDEKKEYYSAEIGINYIQHKFAISIEGLYGKHPKKVRSTIRALQVLWDYSEYGSMVVKKRPGKKPFECPAGFADAYESFQDICKKRQYTVLGSKSIFSVLQKFIVFMNDSKVSNTSAITENLIIKFLCSYSACSTRYIATIVSTLRNYLTFVHEEGFLKKDMTPCLPKVKINRSGFIPSTWKQEDVHKLLNTIDRNNPGGKRDYAILLLVTRLGLRVSDIRVLKLENVNWVRKTISIVMQKTKQPLELPLLEDIGWAVIDYLKNGRPETKSNRIFIRHKAPYNGFSDYNCLSRMLGRRMKKAGIDMTGQKCGLHTLRNTLARVMLESGATLPVISETLGHQNIQTTSIYLKIDIEGLRNCVIDPEEVFHD